MMTTIALSVTMTAALLLIAYLDRRLRRLASATWECIGMLKVRMREHDIASGGFWTFDGKSVRVRDLTNRQLREILTDFEAPLMDGAEREKLERENDRRRVEAMRSKPVRRVHK